MPDQIGNIEVPEIAPSGVFPIVPDYPHGRARGTRIRSSFSSGALTVRFDNERNQSVVLGRR
jgi:hypothetical protein